MEERGGDKLAKKQRMKGEGKGRKKGEAEK